MKKIKLLFLLTAAVTLYSCLGLAVDIQMNKDGSGKLTMEYRVSRAIESLGVLDGSEKPVIPVGRSDWERSIELIPGARIASFSSNQKDNDIITSVVIQFDNPAALLMILDPGNSRSSASLNNNSFNFILNDKSSAMDFSEYDESLMELARMMFAEYNFSLSFTAPANSTLTITDKDGHAAALPAQSEVVSTGRKVSMKMGIMELIEMKNGLGVKINW